MNSSCVLKDVASLRGKIKIAKENGKKIAFVPTMGALHDGHLSLVDLARDLADIVVVSIFVNPIQFNNQSDYINYPSTVEDDIKLLQDKLVDIIYIPSKSEIYKTGFSSSVTISGITDILCGKYRQGHFTGVATIVIKLFNQVKPDIAIFGKKDYQQAMVIKKMVSDLDVDVEIILADTKREDSGLALSSRNKRLSDKEREIIAPIIYQTLINIKDDIIRSHGSDNFDIDILLSKYKKYLLSNKIDKIDYLEIRNENNLEIIENIADIKIGKSVIFIAAYIREIRLIDNVVI